MAFRQSLVVALLLAMLAAHGRAQGTAPPKPQSADAIMQAAYKKARDGKKPVLVLFDATW